MKIEHIAIWVRDLEVMKNFYQKYFNASVNDLYENAQKQFKSYFLSLESGARIELMNNPEVFSAADSTALGLAHFSVSVGSKEEVLNLTERLRADGFCIKSEPRTTGDGYFESVILDPEGNLIEITI